VAALLLPLAVVNGLVRAPRISPAWDWLMALGYLAAAIMALLPLITARYSRHASGDPNASLQANRLHRWLGYALVVLVLVHALGLLVLEPVSLAYLKPTAPAGMLAALLAAALLLGLIATALARHRLYLRQGRWREDHAVLSVLILLLTGWHIVDSGHYLRGALGLALLGLLFAAPTVVSLRLLLGGRRGPPRAPATRTAKELPSRARLRRRLWWFLLLALLAGLLASLLFTLPWPPAIDPAPVA
jgi:hypothetical protein